MELYLIRHGLAGERGQYTNDDERPLTDEGEKKTAAVARQLKDKGIRFDLVLTSGLMRAKQTAAILEKAKLTPRVEESAALRPGGEIEEWINWLGCWSDYNDRSRLALVGHEPDLSQWAELLVWGEIKEKLNLKKAGIIGLNLPSRENLIAQSELFLLISPKWFI
ncbi:MAG: 2,3-bisphosphoglycerate-dependent phosphoglycerate mutase [Chroococcopsis gigantea SAG 12.99]|jgi:phosphohistidine phosphatase|nr:phosphohistidine phosphatase SixA [Chlorogloea purpurea SAG 13.99]MDV3002262.1 2,3-bisphosphoglycerate-dependent phosphoglycerate mutase [Chroococcopsis gigantea SAG 12.99]